jgi:hypothetical protein
MVITLASAARPLEAASQADRSLTRDSYGRAGTIVVIVENAAAARPAKQPAGAGEPPAENESFQ